MEKIRVLLVDNSSDVRHGLQSILRAHPDIEVVGEAASGWKAMAEAQRLQPSIVLIDAQLPDMYGAEATRRIKERLPNVKILLLTVHTSYVEEALAAGADDCLAKDCSRQELLCAIRELGKQG